MVQLLSLTAGAYLTRYQHAGLLDDLEQAIGIWQAPLGDRAERTAEWASLLGNAYQQRFTSIPDMADLDQAIEHGELAVAATSPADPRLGTRLGKLAVPVNNANQAAEEVWVMDRPVPA